MYPSRARLICIVFLMIYAAPQSVSTRPELPRGRSAAAPGTLQGGQDEAPDRPRGRSPILRKDTNTRNTVNALAQQTELSFESGVHFVH